MHAGHEEDAGQHMKSAIPRQFGVFSPCYNVRHARDKVHKGI